MVYPAKSLFSFLLLCFSLIPFLPAQTNVSGGIYANATWTLANSPYTMTGPVVVFPGKTLTIEPGVEVRVMENGFTTGMHYYLEVRGSLIAQGTPGLPIRFRGATDTTALGSWLGIHVKSSQGGNISMDRFHLANSYWGIYYDLPPAFSPLSFQDCRFGYNVYGYSSIGPTAFTNCLFDNNSVGYYGTYSPDSANFNNCSFIANSAHGIYALGNTYRIQNCVFNRNMNGMVGGYSGTLQNCALDSNAIGLNMLNNAVIENCSFLNNDSATIYMLNSTVRFNTFRDNGVAVEAGAGMVIHDNEIIQNRVGVVIPYALNFSDQQPSVINNRICGNLQYNVENGSDLNFGLDTNCFCLPDSASIEATLYDGYDDFTRGLLNFAVFDTSCSFVLNRVIKVEMGTTAIVPASQEKDFGVFPNPTADLLRVRSKFEVQDWAMHNVSGQLILQGDALPAGSEIQMGSLPSGVYILSCTLENGQQVRTRVMRE